MTAGDSWEVWKMPVKQWRIICPDECKGMTEHLSEVKEPASMIKTLLRHARIQIEQAEKAHEHAPRQQVLSEAR